MSNSETLLKAALNRLGARLNKEIINSTENLAAKAQKAPDQIKEEWNIFKKEVLKEYKRISKKEKNVDPSNFKEEESYSNKSIQNTIDQLRSKVLELNKKVE